MRRFFLGFILGAASIVAVLVGIGHFLDVAVFGRDALSGIEDPIAATLSSTASGSGNAQLRTYRVGDRADNTLELVVSVKREGKEIKATIASVRYNGGTTMTASDNSLAFEWSLTETDAVKELEQKLELGSGADKQKTQAKFRADRDTTTIKVDLPAPDRQVERPGLVLLRLATDHGALVIEFD